MPERIISYDQLRNTHDGEPIIFATEQMSSLGHPVVIDFRLYRPKVSHGTWILLTALADDTPIGFIDARFVTAFGNGIIHTPHNRQLGIYLGPHKNIRTLANSDGFFLKEEERNRGIGGALFTVAKEVLATLGAKHLLVQDPSDRAKSFYERHGGIGKNGNYYYDLTQNSS